MLQILKKFKLEKGVNHYGRSHYYLSNTDIGAAKELLPPEELIVWMQKINIHKAKDILDVTMSFNEVDPDAPVIATGLKDDSKYYL